MKNHFSVWKKFDNGSVELIKLLDIVQFITEKGIQRIDLMKINIEGEEFNLLPRLLDSPLVQICRNLQIQFHDFVENSEILRKNMR